MTRAKLTLDWLRFNKEGFSLSTTDFTTDERGVSLKWGSSYADWVIVQLGGREIARFGNGMIHGMIYLTGEGMDAAEIHNEILAEHDVNFYVAPNPMNNGLLAVYFENTHGWKADLNGRAFLERHHSVYVLGEDDREFEGVGSVFFVEIRGVGSYRHYDRDHHRAEHVRYCMELLDFEDMIDRDMSVEEMGDIA